MPLLIGNNPTLDEFVAAVQVWAGQVDGLNAAERLTQLTDGVASLPTVQAGTILAYGGASAPSGYLICNGDAVSRTTYANLFTVIGTTYGTGNGSTTFNVPNLRGRFALGKATSGTGSTLGASGGSIDHTHTGGSVSGSTGNESSHTHGAGSYSADEPGSFGKTFVDDNNDGITREVATDDHTQVVIGTSGSGSAHNHSAGTLAVGTSGSANPPYAVVNYIVKT